MDRYYLAVDLGASGGRLILGGQDGRGFLTIEEIRRFPNGAVNRGGRLCWDYDRLFSEILDGMKQCADMGKIPVSMGVDTWGVDYVLLDKDGRITGDCVAYRDSRTTGVDAQVSARIPEAELYARTGIQKQPYNTIYQLWTVREQLERAGMFLMVPDYFHYLLTGVCTNEYTEASTTGLLNAARKTWDSELLDLLGYPRRLFRELNHPGDAAGNLRPEIAKRVGFDCKVVLPATHDTGSAVAAAPLEEGSVYISSGTWSLLGVESPEPVITEEGRIRNFTNEGGVEHRYRYLKNIMGLWMIQEVRRELGNSLGYEELAAAAEREERFLSVVDVTDVRYLSPESMIREIRTGCGETGQPEPGTPGELAKCVYLSLAKCYNESVRELSGLTGQTYKRLNIIGGGCRNEYLNRLAREETGLDPAAGPAEATAIGNIAVQMIADGEIADLNSARALIARSKL